MATGVSFAAKGKLKSEIPGVVANNGTHELLWLVLSLHHRAQRDCLRRRGGGREPVRAQVMGRQDRRRETCSESKKQSNEIRPVSANILAAVGSTTSCFWHNTPRREQAQKRRPPAGLTSLEALVEHASFHPPALVNHQTARDPMSLLVEGQVIRGTYEVERIIGEGAFAEVYRVRHRFLGRQAMKVFKMVGMTMEEAFNKWPPLRERHEYQLRLWRRGVSG